MQRTALFLALLLGSHVPLQAQGSFHTSEQGCPAPTSDSGPVLFGRMSSGDWHLDHSSLTFVAEGGQWSLVPGGEYIDRTLAATVLPVGDDIIIGPLGLSFAFAYPGGAGSTTSIDVSLNGRVYLEAGTNPFTGGNGILMDFLAATPGVSALGTDLNTTFDGRMFFEERMIGNEMVAVITWDEVPEAPNVGANTFQCQLWSDGRVVLSYRETNGVQSTANAIVGVSAGGGAANPGPSDLAQPIRLFLEGGEPVIGGEVTLAATGIPLSATAARLIIGRPGMPLPVRHTQLGSTVDCLLWVTPESEVPMDLTPPTARVSLPWAYEPGLVGLTLECQALVLDSASPGETLVSDRGTLQVGEPPDLRFVAEGKNSFRGSPPEEGFFRLESSPGADHADIELLEVRLLGNQAAFDTVGNAGLDGQGYFSDGNGGGPSCRNAFYGTDTITGLVYGGPLQGPGCDGNGSTGWVGEDPQSSSVTRFRTLVFEFEDFTAGEVFRFDCDTDRVEWAAGFQPIHVTVQLTSGELFEVPVQMLSTERAEGVLIQ